MKVTEKVVKIRTNGDKTSGRREVKGGCVVRDLKIRKTQEPSLEVLSSWS